MAATADGIASHTALANNHGTAGERNTIQGVQQSARCVRALGSRKADPAQAGEAGRMDVGEGDRQNNSGDAGLGLHSYRSALVRRAEAGSRRV